MKAFCHLSRTQAALYQRAVEELAQALDTVEGMNRRGTVLSFLMRFKQICNHPSQWLGDGAWTEADSGKFARLREIAEVVAAKQEKVLVFTQFREATQPIATFLGNVFGREGLVLHGGTAVAKRKELVRRFQEDELTPFFVLSLKAGGVRPEPDGRVARRALRSMVESGRREPGHRPGVSNRPVTQRARAQVRLPWHGRGQDRSVDRIEAGARQGRARWRRRIAVDRIERQAVARSCRA